MQTELHPELAASLEKGWVRHPFVNANFHGLSWPNGMTQAEMLNAQFEEKTIAVANAREAGDWASYIFIHERPWRIVALQEAMWEGNWRKVVPLVGDVWRDSENIRHHLDDWQSIWSDVLWSGHLRRTMTPYERRALRAMPASLTVYRGVSHAEAVDGLSWTIDRAKGEWFARRNAYDGSPALLATGRVKKADVLAYFAGRNEREIVAFPENIERIDLSMLTSELEALAA